MDVTQAGANLARRVSAVDAGAWERAGDEAGYATTQQATLDMISQAVAQHSESQLSWAQSMIDAIVMRLSMSEQAKYANAGEWSPGTVDPASARVSYLGALEEELTAIGSTGASLGSALVSPATGAARAVGSAAGDVLGDVAKWILPLAIVVLIALYMLRK